MKKIVLAALLCLAYALPATAAQGPYVGFGGGLSINHDADIKISGLGTAEIEYDPGYGFNLVGGYNLDAVRLEAEFAYRVADVDNVSGPGGSFGVSGADLTTMSYMANVYYDVETRSPVKPFFGVGLGLINGEIDDNGDSLDDTVFGYQFTLGMTGKVDKNVNLDCYYRFQGITEDFEEYGAKLEYTNSSIFVGVRFNL